MNQMSLQDLEQQTILFGKTKYGMKFSQAFEDVSWTRFIVSRYETSTKKEHRLYIQYVRLRLRQLEVEELSPEERYYLNQPSRSHLGARAEAASDICSGTARDRPGDDPAGDSDTGDPLTSKVACCM